VPAWAWLRKIFGIKPTASEVFAGVTDPAAAFSIQERAAARISFGVYSAAI